MKIAVVGAGFAGLSFSWYYSKLFPNDNLTVWDPKPVEKRASSNAFLLHSFIHFKSKLNWKGREAFQAASSLIEESAQYALEPISIKRPFIKLANHHSQLDSFKEAAELYEELTWLEETPFGYPGLEVKEAYQLRSDLYLEALQKGCSSRGVQFVSRTFEKSDAANFDRILFASGDQTLGYFPQIKGSEVKGQVFKIKWPEDLKLPCALTAYKCHIIPSFDQKEITLGSTFERYFEDKEPNLDVALERLAPHLEFLFPKLNKRDVLSTSTGVRFNASNRLPLIGRIDNKVWIFSALGSKGLLYHAYLGEKLAYAFKENEAGNLPKELRTF